MSPVQSLKDSGLKATLPRRKILELFESSKVRHLSAEDVYKALIAEGIAVGLATVYRVLTQFEQAGLLSRQHFETGKAVFELNQGGHHDHLVCLQCGRVEEFYDPEIEKRPVDVLGGKMAHLARLEELEDPAPRQRGLEAAVLQALRAVHSATIIGG